MDPMENTKNLRAAKLPPTAPKADSPAFHNMQIDLFQTFLCNTDNERQRLSNTIEFWDSIPKYSVSKQEMAKKRTADGLLKPLELRFRFRGKEFLVVIHPAGIRDKDGVFRHYYPSASEELTEDALRKVAAERSQGFFEDEPFRSGVSFTIHQLRTELARHGHGRTYDDTVKSLHVLAGSNIEIYCEGSSGEGFARANFLPFLSAASKGGRLDQDEDSRWVAHFHPLVTRSIHAIDYRQYDYQSTMAHTSQLARWLRRLLSSKFNFASMTTTFEILWSTVRRDSNLLNYTRDRDGMAALDQATLELKAHGAIHRFDREEIKGLRGKVADIRYTFYPSTAFVREVKAANKRLLLAANPPPGTRR